MTFKEVQRFRQPWLWVLVGAMVLVDVWAMVQQLVFGIPFGNRPMSDAAFSIVGPLIAVGLPLFLALPVLRTRVDAGVVTLQFWPFHLRPRRIPLDTVVGCEVRRYGFLNYGGWGIRLGGLRETAYLVSGSKGVRLHLADGRRVMIGSQRAEELAAVIDRHLESRGARSGGGAGGGNPTNVNRGAT